MIELIENLRTPALLIDRARLIENCDRMRAKAEHSGVIFRPHVKTHKSIEIARLQHGGNRGPITVSTLAEGEYFAGDGFKDITYAVPLAVEKIFCAAALAAKVKRLNLLVDNLAIVDALEAFGRKEKLKTRFDLFLKVDCGYHRAGVDPQSPYALQVADAIANSTYCNFNGLLTHAGHAYHAATEPERKALAEHEQRVLSEFRDVLKMPSLVRSVGSTPTAMAVDRFDDCDEVRPGNYVFFDAYQAALGSCTIDDCALTVMTSVIGSYPAERRILTDAGSLALSREGGFATSDYGAVCDLEMQLLPLDFVAMSQEHGQLKWREHARESDLARVSVGSRLRIVPNHSCITAAQHPTYFVVGDHDVHDRWRPVRGW